MKISQFKEIVLSKISKILKEESMRPDPRCYNNIKYILDNHLFGKSHSGEDIKIPFLKEVFKKFSRELSNLIDKKHYPQELKKKTLRAFSSTCKALKEQYSTHKSSPRKQHQHIQGNENLIAIFKDTYETSKTHPRSISEIIRNTKCYQTNQEGAGQLFSSSPGQNNEMPVTLSADEKHFDTQINVLNNDTLVVALQMINQGISNPLVLNLANRFSVGGGVVHGSRAQEEDLMRRTNYYFALSQPALSHSVKEGKHKGRRHYHSPIPEFGSIYTPDVCVFKDSKYREIAPFTASFIAVAGYDLGKPDKLDNSEKKHLLNFAGEFEPEKILEFTQRKIRHILDVALANGHHDLVLGALSCGAFKLKNEEPGQTARIVALAFRLVLEEEQYKNKFRTINFAVLDKNPGPDTNFTIFSEMLSDLGTKDYLTSHDNSAEEDFLVDLKPGIHYSNRTYKSDEAESHNDDDLNMKIKAAGRSYRTI